MLLNGGKRVYPHRYRSDHRSWRGDCAGRCAHCLQVAGGLRRVVIGAPVLISNTTTVLGTTNAVVDVASGTSTSTATVNTFGPATVATGDLGTCATPAANNTNPTGCSLAGTPVTVDATF
ncbi:MAG: hypothetical protein IPL18_15035 [Sphingomonadales bacterium]|nr:hypothetical protein [Sphingomonadales bacterium]